MHLFRNTTKEWCTVSIRGAEGELYEITSTPGHKYFVPSNRVRKDSRAPEHASYAGLSEKWVSACDLKHGDKVLLSDGTLCEVEGVSCKKLSEPETTYNLEVADFHTYYVSDACVLVHNLNCGDFKKLDAKEIARRGNISVDDFHRTVKPRILKDAPKNLGKNPDILLNRKNVVGLQSRINKNSYNTGKRLEDFIDGLRK